MVRPSSLFFASALIAHSDLVLFLIAFEYRERLVQAKWLSVFTLHWPVSAFNSPSSFPVIAQAGKLSLSTPNFLGSRLNSAVPFILPLISVRFN